MEKKYSLHKLWFHYTDEWYYPDGLGPTIGVFPTLELAEAEKKKRDRVALRAMGSPDYLRDLTHFFEKTYDKTAAEVVAFAQSQQWQDSLREQRYGNSDGTYWELSLPKDATAEQMDTLLDLTKASFHRIIEYKSVKEYSYVKLNYDFWGKKAFDHFKAEGLLEPRKPFILGEADKGFYLVHKPAKGRKSAKIPSSDLARQMAVKTLIDYIIAFPENTFLGKNYIGEWAIQPELLRAYLAGCDSVTLTTHLVGPENIKAFSAKLKKIKSMTVLGDGMLYFESVTFNPYEEAYINEILGLMELLTVKPFVITDQIAEINGEVVEDYKQEGGLF